MLSKQWLPVLLAFPFRQLECGLGGPGRAHPTRPCHPKGIEPGSDLEHLDE